MKLVLILVSFEDLSFVEDESEKGYVFGHQNLRNKHGGRWVFTRSNFAIALTWNSLYLPSANATSIEAAAKTRREQAKDLIFTSSVYDGSWGRT